MNLNVHHNKQTNSFLQRADLLALLQPLPGEQILDAGCGNGDLLARIDAVGAFATGIDQSEVTVRKARLKYPDLNIQVKDACQYRTDIEYDAVISNATIHWIKNAPAVAYSIWLALRKGGRFVAEFAGSGNVDVLMSAMKDELETRGYSWAGRSPWYFPTIGEYTSLLEHTGFRVMLAEHFDSLTPLKGDTGIARWLDGFSKHFFYDVTPADKASIYSAIEARVKDELYREGQWMIDTSRLRIIAIKDS